MIRNSSTGSIDSEPVAAAHATTGGSAPAAPPITMFCAVQRGEDHQRHHPRLHEREVVTDLGLGNPGQFDGVVIDDRQDGSRLVSGRGAPRERAANSAYCTRGSTSNWWNGGGDGSVHSSVVAPAPHGLSAACCFLAKASITP